MLSGTFKNLPKQLISFPTNFYVVSLTILCMDICEQFCYCVTQNKNKTLLHVSYHKMLRIAQSMDQYFSLLLSFQLLYQSKIALCSVLSHKNNPNIIVYFITPQKRHLYQKNYFCLLGTRSMTYYL